MTLEEKYNIVIINNRRYYREDLKKRSYSYTNSTPFLFQYEDIKIEEHSWKNMTIRLVEALNSKHPKSHTELLNLENDWGKQQVFSLTKKSNYDIFDSSMYINLNHTAVHSMWTIQLLLNFYGVDLDKAVFLIKRNGVSEPKEVKDYYISKNMSGFYRYLKTTYEYDDDRAERVLKNIRNLDKYMSKISPSYESLFLIDNSGIFNNYSKELVGYMKNIVVYKDDRLYTVVEGYLSKLSRYIYLTYDKKQNK